MLNLRLTWIAYFLMLSFLSLTFAQEHLIRQNTALLQQSRYKKDRTLQLKNKRQVIQQIKETLSYPSNTTDGPHNIYNKTVLSKQSAMPYVMTEELVETWQMATPDSQLNLFSYDENANNTRKISLFREDNSWQNFWTDTMSYNTSNYLVEKMSKLWFDSQWGNQIKTMYTYDPADNLLEENNYYWDGASWQVASRIKYTFGENDNLIEELSQAWDTGNWVDNYKFTMTYDSLNNIATRHAMYDEGKGLENTGFTFYTYNNNNQLIEDLFKAWEDGAWVNWEIITITYDDAGNEAERLNKVWEASDWVNSFKSIFTYNEYNNMSEWLGNEWSGSTWVNILRDTYTYDDNQNNTITLSETDWDGEGWKNSGRSTRKYELLVTGLESRDDLILSDFELKQNFPNPFNPATVISYKLKVKSDVSLNVYNVLGKRVATLVQENQSAGTYLFTFDAEHLASGTYIYRLQTDKSIQTKKMTLLR